MKLKKPNILGISIGNYPAIYIANHFDVGKLIIVGTGRTLGESMWEGIATQKTKKEAIKKGIKSPEEYNLFIKGTNPIENTKNLPMDIKIFYGTRDKYIPSKDIHKLIEKIKENKNRKVVVKRYNGRGHVLTLLKFGLDKNL